MRDANGFCVEELLIATIAGELQGLAHVAVGASSPIPGAAALLARERSGQRLEVSLLGSVEENSFTDGGVELFDCAAQGRIDAFFLGGAQIDGQANINLVGVDGYPNSRVRFPGSFGSAYLYFLVPRVILFTLAHSPRNLVRRVDFVSAPGVSEPNVHRPGGPHKLVTGLCVLDFDRQRGRFVLASVHPGCDAAAVRAQTGFDYDEPDHVPTTPAPDAATLESIRGPVGAAIARTYPKFGREVLGIRC
ncbi:MAG: CoA-transferase [Gammaproteobacteria bacterium]